MCLLSTYAEQKSILAHGNICEKIPSENGGYMMVAIGGRHIGGDFTMQDADILADILNKLDIPLLITSSKRTNSLVFEYFVSKLKNASDSYDYKLRTKDNPYREYIKKASYILVSGDSQKMLSEAATSGAATCVYANQSLGLAELAAVKHFIANGFAIDINNFDKAKTTTPIHEAERLARFVNSSKY
jgi:mitochondrial fission protein ELM1